MLLHPCGRLHGPGAPWGTRPLWREFAVQALAAGVRIGHIVSATGSGGTTAGLLLGAKRFLPGVKVTGIAVDTDPFDEIVPRLAEEAAGLLEWPFRREKNDFEMVSHVGPGYAVPQSGGHPLYRGAGPERGASCWTRSTPARPLPA